MKSGKKILLNTTSVIMELCWIYALSAFLMNIFLSMEYPYVSVAAFVFGALVAGLLTRIKWRVLYKLLIKLFTYFITTLIIINFFYYPDYSFFSGRWIIDFFSSPRQAFEWIEIAVVLLLTALFWISGSAAVNRKKSYFTICSRFDIGLAAFFCIFLGKLVLVVKNVASVNLSLAFSLLFPYLIFGLLSIALSKDENKTHKEFLPGYGGIGFLAGFTALVLLVAGCIILLMPVLTMAADMSFRALKNGSGFLPLLFHLIQIIITPGTVRESPDAVSVTLPTVNITNGWLSGLIETIVSWGIMGVVFLVVLLVIGMLTILAIRWLLRKIIMLLNRLLSRSGFASKNPEQAVGVLYIFIILWNVFKYLYNIIIHSFRKNRTAADVYQMLIRWGMRSGFSHSANETALEYGGRLNRYFPGLRTEINEIVNTFNNESYGGIKSSHAFSKAKHAMRALRKPRYFFLRIKHYVKRLNDGVETKQNIKTTG